MMTTYRKGKGVPKECFTEVPDVLLQSNGKMGGLPGQAQAEAIRLASELQAQQEVADAPSGSLSPRTEAPILNQMLTGHIKVFFQLWQKQHLLVSSVMPWWHRQSLRSQTYRGTKPYR